MPDHIEQLAARLRALREEWGDDMARAGLEKQAAALPEADRARLRALAFGAPAAPAPAGLSVAGDAQTAQQINVAAGGSVGLAVATLQLFFGERPGEDDEQLLAAYLDSLADDCQRLRLHRLTGKRQSGSERPSQADGLRLQDVYTSLTTDGPPVVVHQRQRRAAWIRRLLERARIAERSPEQVAPEQVRMPVISATKLVEAGEGFTVHLERSASRPASISALVQGADPDALLPLQLVRPELALEAIRAERRLVLLGEPGAGKSTALRYLALLLAQRLRGPVTRIPGWPEGDTPVPVILPLGQVAAALRAGAADAYAALLQVLGDVLEAGVRGGLRRFLTPALRSGGLLLLCDGLDELPASATDGGAPPRAAVAAALRRLARETRARMVVTSRVLPYRAPGDWKLLPEDGWALRTVQPLAFGQTRAFVRGWYAALAATDPDLADGKATERADDLIAELEQTARLRPLVRSPLLLTMLAILHYNTGDVPRDRAKLYEECVELLLDRWEPERQPGTPRQSLIARLGLPSLDPLRQVIHELAYQAHLAPPGDDGRGMIGVEPLTLRMFTFFKRLGSLADADAKVQTFLCMLNDEDSGLLQRRGDEGYALPHLTFQEYLAACHLADHPRMVEEAYTRWAGADRERWREALLLLIGRLHQQGKAEKEGLPWLKLLAGAKVRGAPKGVAQRGQDAVLAALCYAELRERGAFAGSMLDIEDELEAPLRAAITPLLATPDPAIPTADRIAAARVLGDLGDPRFPVEPGGWRRELGRRDTTFTAQGDHYWRYVPGGRYPIGGWEEGQPSADLELAAFWVARLPITVAQYAPFVAEGYGEGAERWWGQEGWAWKQRRGLLAPFAWGASGYVGANQPLVTMTWYEATAYCAWLSERLADALPAGYALRLPTEAEWEAAAAYDDQGQRRSYPWGEEEPSLERAIYSQARQTSPASVGCCPAGTAACGALDLAGSVWELTASDYRAYPTESHLPQTNPTSGRTAWRGGSWYNRSLTLHCGVRAEYSLDFRNIVNGFRIVLAPSRQLRLRSG